MFSIYLLRGNNDSKQQIYKIGIHSGSQAKLTTRYNTALPNHSIYKFYTFSDQKLVRQIENDIKELYKSNRILNSNENLSEWFNLNDNELDAINTFILSNNPINNLYNNYSFSSIELKQMLDRKEIKFPIYQRPIDEDRITEIKSYINEQHKSRSFILPTIIFNKINGNYNIIDGQHRLMSIINLDFVLYVNVTVYNELNYKEELDMFRSLNKAVPCLDIYLSDGTLKEIKNELECSLKSIFPTRCSTSKNCRVPNFHLDTLLNGIFGKLNNQESVFDKLYSEGKIIDSKSLLTELLKINTITGSKLQSPNGFSYYLLNCPNSGSKHNLERFQDMINKEKKCFIGFISILRLTCALSNNKILDY